MNAIVMVGHITHPVLADERDVLTCQETECIAQA
jgi:hypothetical protein